MSAVFNRVIQNIGKLSSDEKALVAHCLISSLELKHDDNVDKAWGELAQKRFIELESGAKKGVSWESIKKEVTR
ncbi:addiction module protein [Marinobacter gelidimuriae]|uniref:addiction module protein n=1 Tax=Marinobacter gelidimuriae TaxID=2739064 RepID=UPI0003736F68|nr:addiction module protein [Marinobacter gelidimuriae]